MRIFRIAHIDNQQGMWYDRNGKFAGRIHKFYKTFKNTNLEMPYDEQIVGYLSGTDSLDTLFDWFSIDDILMLLKDGYRITEYEANLNDLKYNDQFKHWLIKESIKPTKIWNLSETIGAMQNNE